MQRRARVLKFGGSLKVFTESVRKPQLQRNPSKIMTLAIKFE